MLRLAPGRARSAVGGLLLACIVTSAPAGDLVQEAHRWMGATARQMGVPSTLWCADAMGVWLRRAGYPSTGSRLAMSYARYGRPASPTCIGCIAVLTRRGGGHVGVVTGRDFRGNPIVISGNHNRRVGEAVYPARRVVAYRQP